MFTLVSIGATVMAALASYVIYSPGLGEHTNTDLVKFALGGLSSGSPRAITF